MRKNRMTKKRNGGGLKEKIKSWFRRKPKVTSESYALPMSAPLSNLTTYNTGFANRKSARTIRRSNSRKPAFRTPSARVLSPRFSFANLDSPSKTAKNLYQPRVAAFSEEMY